MMSEIKLSKVLEQLLENARQLGGKSGPLTAERFIVAAIDYSFGEKGAFYTAVESAKILSALHTVFHRVAGGLTRISEEFLAHINNRHDNYPADSIYMQKQLKKAWESVLRSGWEELETDVLIENILTEPNAFISQYAGAKALQTEKHEAIIKS